MEFALYKWPPSRINNLLKVGAKPQLDRIARVGRK